MRGPHRVAEVLATVETETPYGGLSVSYESLGWIWVAMAPRTLARSEGPAPGPRNERTTAETRGDPRLQVGRRLRLSGADWRIEAVDEAASGRVRLALERSR